MREKERRKVEKQHKKQEKEFTKQHRDKRREQYEQPNPYPKTKRIRILDFLRAPDLYKGIGLFLISQLIMASMTASTNLPDIAFTIRAVTLALSILFIYIALHMINKRQAKEPRTRRRVNMVQVLNILLAMVGLTLASTFLINMLNITPEVQSNQNAINELSSQAPVMMFILVVFMSPIIEEVVFRELLPYAAGPSQLSFILMTVLFMVLHSPDGIAGWMDYGILSGGFLYARLKSNNVYTAIIVHIAWNSMSMLP